MKTCATIQKHMVNTCVDDCCNCHTSDDVDDDVDDDDDDDDDGSGDDEDVNCKEDTMTPGRHPEKRSDPLCEETSKPRRKELVLDVRESHVVKYDLSRKEHQKLDVHTNKSEWTFLIALSEDRGVDYGEGGTYFEGLNAMIHLQRSQMLIFWGKLRHKGVKITEGSR